MARPPKLVRNLIHKQIRVCLTENQLDELRQMSIDTCRPMSMIARDAVVGVLRQANQSIIDRDAAVFRRDPVGRETMVTYRATIKQLDNGSYMASWMTDTGPRCCVVQLRQDMWWIDEPRSR